MKSYRGTPPYPRGLAFAVLAAVTGITLTGSAAAQTPAGVRVRVERSDKVGQTPLWIPVRVTVTEGDGGRPLSVDHLAFAAARNGQADGQHGEKKAPGVRGCPPI